MALTSESFIAERAQVTCRELNQLSLVSCTALQGLLERSWLCGVLPVEILASHILSQFWVIGIQVTAAPRHAREHSLVSWHGLACPLPLIPPLVTKQRQQ